jgi:arginyl-tRNA--protein-N-Asp/Glu arginylyltransferase
LPSENTKTINVGITKIFPCSYLPDQEEQLIMLLTPQDNAKSSYPTLIANGFRRSGEQIYRPNCQHCNACQSLRIPIATFKHSRSQKRLLKKNKDFTIKISQQKREQYFTLYQRYIDNVHRQGPMFPASKQNYDEFIKSSWNTCLFIEVYDQEKLISVSITDIIKTTNTLDWSAFYCFYDPDYKDFSIGKYAVLKQIELARERQVDCLYLGYYIKDCQKMNYKNQFSPHQRLIDGQWMNFE